MSRDDKIAKLIQARRADSWNRVQLVDGAESAVLRSVVEDLLGRYRVANILDYFNRERSPE